MSFSPGDVVGVFFKGMNQKFVDGSSNKPYKLTIKNKWVVDGKDCWIFEEESDFRGEKTLFHWLEGSDPFVGEIVPTQDNVNIFMKAITENDLEKVQALLSENYSVRVKDAHGQTPLLLACTLGHEDIVREILTRRGAQWINESSDGWTPLMAASYAGNSWIVSELLRRGANKHLKRRDGNVLKSALDYATMGDNPENIVPLLSVNNSRKGGKRKSRRRRYTNRR